MKFVYNTKLSGVIEAPIIPHASVFALKACALCRDKSSVYGILLDEKTEETVSAVKSVGCKLSRKGLGISILPPKDVKMAFKKLFQEEISRIGEDFREQGTFIIDNENDDDVLTAVLGAIVFFNSCEIKFIKQISDKAYFSDALEIIKTLGGALQYDGENAIKVLPGAAIVGSDHVFVDGDWNVGAFGLSCAALGFDVGVSNVFSHASHQNKSQIQKYLTDMGATIFEPQAGTKCITFKEGKKAVKIDAKECPELLPYVMIIASQTDGETEIYNITREIVYMNNNALFNTVSMLKQLGLEVTANRAETIGIKGKKTFDGGIKINCRNDVLLSFTAILATICSKKANVLENCEIIDEVYPTFWSEFSKIGGFAE